MANSHRFNAQHLPTEARAFQSMIWPGLNQSIPGAFKRARLVVLQFYFISGGGRLVPRFMELISIAFDASITHMYAPGVRRHIQGSLKAGATPEEIMTVLQICVSMGVQACAKGVPILAEELERNPTN